MSNNKMDAINALKNKMSDSSNLKSPKVEKSVPLSKSKANNVPWYPATPQLKKELKQLALDEESSMNALLSEGIKLVFAKRGKDYSSYL